MRKCPVSHLDQLQQGVRVGRLALRFYGDQGQEADHGAGRGSPPDSKSDTIAVGQEGGTQQGGAVEPRRDDSGSSEANAYGAVGHHEAVLLLVGGSYWTWESEAYVSVDLLSSLKVFLRDLVTQIMPMYQGQYRIQLKYACKSYQGQTPDQSRPRLHIRLPVAEVVWVSQT